jgi:CHAT domain-containing protein
MKNLLILYILLNYISLNAQRCDIVTGIFEIERFEARGEFKAALEVAAEIQLCRTIAPSDRVKLLIAQYKVQRDKYDFRMAETSLKMAKYILEMNGNPLDFEFNFLLAENYADLGNSEAYFAIIPAIKDKVLATSNSNNELLGRYYLASFSNTNKNTQLTQAIKYLQSASMEFEKNSDPPIFYYGNTLRSLGNMYRNAADFDKSIFYYKKGKSFIEEHFPPDHFEIAYYDYAIGAVYYEKMEYEKALEHFLQAHKIWVNLLKPNDRYMRYLNEAMGDMYWELNDPENALLYFNSSIVNEEKVNNDQSEAAITVADSLVNNGNYAAAINYYQEAYKWREKEFGKNNVQTGACKNFVARAIRFSGDTEGALEAYQEAIQILVPEMTQSSWYENPTTSMHVQSHQYLLESLMAKGELLKELFAKTNEISDLKAALETQEVALLLLEELKDSQMSEASREFWTIRTLSLVESSIETAVKLHQFTNDEKYLHDAFNFSERSKALLLLASLYDHEINSFSNVSEAIILKEKELKQSINEYVGNIESEEKRCNDVREKMLSLWKNKLNSLQNEYNLLIKTIKVEYPEYYQLKYDNQIANLETVQRELLDDNSGLISYFTGAKNTYIFFLTKDQISVRMLEDTPALFELSSGLFATVSSLSRLQREPQISFEQFTQIGFQLYSKLLEPELKGNQFSKLIIIPDGQLCYLPFECLLTRKVTSATRDYKSLPYLLKDYAVSFSPSASIKILTENDENTNDDYLGFAPNYDNQEYALESNQRDGIYLENLQYSSQEIEQAAGLFNGKKVTGKAVTEDLIKNNSSKAGILHLAMHGAIEDEHPLLSKLYFNTSAKEDGILHIYEIYNMNITAQLVILSACNTASGKLVRGEGIVSLERAFQYAGSKALLSTLWTVDDAASLKLTDNFLKNIKSGSPKDIALQQAKLQYLATASPEKLPPFYWSSFKLTGNTNPLVQKSNTKYFLMGFGIVSLFFGFIYFRKIRRNTNTALRKKKSVSV